MKIQTVLPVVLDFLSKKPVEVEPVLEAIRTDAGLLPIREFDDRLGLTAGFAAQWTDSRAGGTHTLLEMLRQRVYGIRACYEDQNDHDALRQEGIFKLLSGRSPDAHDLANQPTLSRFENAVTAAELLRLEGWLLEQFVQSFDTPPAQLTLDIDLFDDPAHGRRQLTFYLGWHDQYQYLARVITCAENDLVVFPVLLHGSARPTLGVVGDLQRVIVRLRQAWPDVRILPRADSGFASPAFYEACEEWHIEYTIGLAMNAVLKRRGRARLHLANHAPPSCRPDRRLSPLRFSSG